MRRKPYHSRDLTYLGADVESNNMILSRTDVSDDDLPAFCLHAMRPLVEKAYGLGSDDILSVILADCSDFDILL